MRHETEKRIRLPPIKLTWDVGCSLVPFLCLADMFAYMDADEARPNIVDMFEVRESERGGRCET